MEPAQGVGDGGQFWGTRLYAYSGRHSVVVSTSYEDGEDTAKVRATAVAMAKAVIAKLR